MIWKKTPGGVREVAAPFSHIDPASRHLLRLIDGLKSEEMLLRHGIGVEIEQFRRLWTGALIEPASGEARPTSSVPATRPALAVFQKDPQLLSVALGQLVSEELGLSGFKLAEKIVQAGSMDELQRIADVVVAKIKERKGQTAAEAARRRLFSFRDPVEPSV